jgi:hypothetical protein
MVFPPGGTVLAHGHQAGGTPAATPGISTPKTKNRMNLNSSG